MATDENKSEDEVEAIALFNQMMLDIAERCLQAPPKFERMYCVNGTTFLLHRGGKSCNQHRLSSSGNRV